MANVVRSLHSSMRPTTRVYSCSNYSQVHYALRDKRIIYYLATIVFTEERGTCHMSFVLGYAFQMQA